MSQPDDAPDRTPDSPPDGPDGPDGPPDGPDGPDGPPDGPPAPARRFAPGMVVVGVLVGAVVAVVLPLTMLATVARSEGPALLGVVLLAVAVLAPAVTGAVLVRRGSPQRRGTGLGLLIGWGAATIIGGGLCVAIISALSQGTSP